MANGSVKIKYQLVPSDSDFKRNYSDEQRQQILEMMKIYRNVCIYAGTVQGLGNDMLEPGVLETLLKIKKQADRLPNEIKQFDPEPFSVIENAIRHINEDY